MGIEPSDGSGTSLLSLSLHRLRKLRRKPMVRAVADEILKLERNCEGLYRSEKVGFCVDADSFFRSAAETFLNAKEQIFIVGWDTDSRTELPIPENYDGPLDEKQKARGGIELLDLLNHLTEKNPKLNVYVLSWDFAFIYLFEREAMPSWKFNRDANERIRFVLDNEHPSLASHHQKIVVVDDRVAFSGGLDLTQRRWDTPEHIGFDPRRVDPGGHAYGPFHDVQICVEGNVAKRLGEIARERWELATRERIAPPQALANGSQFPHGLPVSMRHVNVAISRTIPLGFGHQKSNRPVQEVERLFLDAIAAARRFVYIENQYFTSPAIAKAIAARLREPDGPEIVVVLPRDQTGWIEESTMGLLRSEALRIVEKGDIFGRFRCFYPIVPGLGESYVKVHSKVMIVDDVFVRIGSANMNSRSMGLDTECDLAIEAADRAEVSLGISKLRRDLLGEHLGVDPIEFDARFLVSGSLVETVESFRQGERTLAEMRPSVPAWVRKVVPPGEWIDPRQPNGIRRWFAKRFHRSRHFLGGSLILAVTFALFLISYLESTGAIRIPFITMPNPREIFSDAWEWSRSWDAQKIALNVERIQGEPWTWAAVIVGFVVLSLVFVPVTGMIFGIALVFPPWQALFLSLAGATSSGMVLYGIGRYWAFSKSRFLNRPIVRRISERLAQGGILAVLAVRLAPIAPFTVVGVVAGGLKVPVKNYLIGSILGFLPGISAITLLSSNASRYATTGNVVGLVWILLAMSILVMILPKLIAKFKLRRGRAS